MQFDGSIDIILHSSDAGVDYIASTVEAKEIQYYLWAKAMPGGVATPFQRWLGWEALKKVMTN